jgi:hypothetical protein
MREVAGLTGPQLALLLDLRDFKGVDGMYVNDTYKPARKLVALGFAEWRRYTLAITDAGRRALSHSPAGKDS